VEALAMNATLIRVVILAGVVAAGALAAQEKEFKGRLPPYYSVIVTEGQRREIYRIQERYAARIDELKAQLAALEEERDGEIEAVLSAKQRERLQKVRDEALAKRKKPTSGKPAK
jgi:hypothetical protein